MDGQLIKEKDTNNAVSGEQESSVIVISLDFSIGPYFSEEDDKLVGSVGYTIIPSSDNKQWQTLAKGVEKGAIGNGEMYDLGFFRDAINNAGPNETMQQILKWAGNKGWNTLTGVTLQDVFKAGLSMRDFFKLLKQTTSGADAEGPVVSVEPKAKEDVEKDIVAPISGTENTDWISLDTAETYLTSIPGKNSQAYLMQNADTKDVYLAFWKNSLVSQTIKSTLGGSGLLSVAGAPVKYALATRYWPKFTAQFPATLKIFTVTPSVDSSIQLIRVSHMNTPTDSISLTNITDSKTMNAKFSGVNYVEASTKMLANMFGGLAEIKSKGIEMLGFDQFTAEQGRLTIHAEDTYKLIDVMDKLEDADCVTFLPNNEYLNIIWRNELIELIRRPGERDSEFEGGRLNLLLAIRHSMYFNNTGYILQINKNF